MRSNLSHNAMQAGKSLLKKEYNTELSVDGALDLATRVLLKTMDTTTPSPDKVEMSVLRR